MFIKQKSDKQSKVYPSAEIYIAKMDYLGRLLIPFTLVISQPLFPVVLMRYMLSHQSVLHESIVQPHPSPFYSQSAAVKDG
ncbi:hypothetical protein SAMN04488072_102245 [Lentibacillus halodurans]|uniref:Uncharacterized protein n=1 Tax=Lentibacillus halodurans TaxID=237679 RepID=A0A1I0W5N8_9BACI|nr:hypothetical protein SAMN04488072_102245 [Lentibacillus halodurans]